MTARAHSNPNRSDEIRRRRTQRSQQRLTTVTTRVSNPVQTRPVIVRGNSFGTPIHRQAGTRARRQFYVAMDNAGAELRLPAIPMLNPGWRLLSGLLVIALTVAVFSMLNSPFFRVYAVEVNGLERINAADLGAVLSLENLSIIEINPQEIDAAIAASFPELTDVQVSINMPNFVTISARERQPMLAWEKGDQTFWVDVEGFIFPPRGEAGPLVTIHTDDAIPLAPLSGSDLTLLSQAGVPATGEALAVVELGDQKANRRADMALLNASLQLLQKLPEGSSLLYDQENGLGWTEPQGWQVYIGKDLSNFEEKFALFQSITNHLLDQGTRPAMISVKHLNAPFYRLEQ
jgi:cell division protein FtsQ